MDDNKDSLSQLNTAKETTDSPFESPKSGISIALDFSSIALRDSTHSPTVSPSSVPPTLSPTTSPTNTPTITPTVARVSSDASLDLTPEEVGLIKSKEREILQHRNFTTDDGMDDGMIDDDDGVNDDLETLETPTESVQGEKRGSLVCNGASVDSEVIYWKLVPGDSEYESPITPHHDEHHDRYLTFAYDVGGWYKLTFFNI